VNIVIYNAIYKKVKPLVDSQQGAADTLETKKRDLATIKDRVRVLNDKVNTLQRQLEEAEAQK